MPAITETTPRGHYEFYGQKVTVPHHFAPAHVLTDAEARFANQAHSSVIGNRYGAQVRRALTELNDERAKALKAGTYTGPLDETGKKPVPAAATVADLNWDHQARVDALFSESEPGVAQRGTGVSHDPVLNEMRRLAGVKVREAYKAKGLKFADMTAAKREGGQSQYDYNVDRYVEKFGDQLRSIVEAQFKALAATKAEADEFDIEA